MYIPYITRRKLLRALLVRTKVSRCFRLTGMSYKCGVVLELLCLILNWRTTFRPYRSLSSKR
ncbi:hypothetical protein PBCV1_a010aR [Paramecium bursaria Chlorella virus 1]|uniref:Uncharacterized protein n=1 Tax=Paramecium bursaria Chlorella virus 1 TaxID=10506 RepID=F8TTV9_PBCV1|nr:hypothetical protein PBCV1_a010aR [Paramecium bursaria Chlorella virus 1]AEI70020.1 hypothetical protein [Paramecium bursaria Chlorella virus 1]